MFRLRKLKRKVRSLNRHSPKVFCVGMNKTGTTSVKCALEELGYDVAPQAAAELMLEEWAKRDFRKLMRFCRRYNAFQDIPFSCPHTFLALDQYFPNAKFILTVRDSVDQWYESLGRFHSKICQTQGLPNSEDLKNHSYHYPGYLWECHRFIYGVSEGQEYDEPIYKACYEQHNSSVVDYFRQRSDRLLVLNVAEDDSFCNLAGFLGVEVVDGSTFPWENKT